jgi:hypothetical protein
VQYDNTEQCFSSCGLGSFAERVTENLMNPLTTNSHYFDKCIKNQYFL